MKKFTLTLKIGGCIAIGAFLMSFSVVNDLFEDSSYLQNKLKEHHNEGVAKQSIKRFELNVTNSGFCRYRRYLNNGKIEFFAFNLTKYDGMDYFGNDKSGSLILHTKGEDVIVQTHKDRKGDVDSMANYLSIPLKNVDPENLIDFAERLTKLSEQLRAQQ